MTDELTQREICRPARGALRAPPARSRPAPPCRRRRARARPAASTCSPGCSARRRQRSGSSTKSACRGASDADDAGEGGRGLLAPRGARGSSGRRRSSAARRRAAHPGRRTHGRRRLRRASGPRDARGDELELLKTIAAHVGAASMALAKRRDRSAEAAVGVPRAALAARREARVRAPAAAAPPGRGEGQRRRRGARPRHGPRPAFAADAEAQPRSRGFPGHAGPEAAHSRPENREKPGRLRSSERSRRGGRSTAERAPFPGVPLTRGNS